MLRRTDPGQRTYPDIHLEEETGHPGHVQLRAQDELTPDGPGQVFSWIVWLFGFLFVPFIGVVDVSSRFPSPEYKIVPDVLAISCE